MSANRRRAEYNLSLSGVRYPIPSRSKLDKKDPYPKPNSIRSLPSRFVRRLGGPGPAILSFILTFIVIYIIVNETSFFKSRVSITPVPLKYERNPNHRPEHAYKVDNARPKKPHLVDTHPNKRFTNTTAPDTLYLAYLPHSGFHNQRIALENAAILARLLNRTLLVPPVWLGRVPPWQTLHRLKELLVKADKTGLEHCRDVPKNRATPKECLGYFDGTRVGWDWLVDIDTVTGGKWADRWNFSDDFIFGSPTDGGLGLAQDDVYYFEEDSRYQFRIYDDPEDQADTKSFKARMDIRSLEHLSSYRLLHFGSTFSTSRLRLNLPESRVIREDVLKGMQITNPIIVDLAEKVASLLEVGGTYVALHARVTEHVFRWEAGRNMREAWWSLGRNLRVEDEALAQAEKTVWDRSLGWRSEVLRAEGGKDGYRSAEDLPSKDVIEDSRTVLTRDDYPGIPSSHRDSYAEKNRYLAQSLAPLGPIKKQPFSLHCPRLLHTSSSLLPLNRALFLASDSPDPTSHPALRLVHSTYPCTFTLSSPGIRELVENSLGGLVNDLDGVPLKGFMLAFADAEVAARARIVVGTRGSTFSRFVLDIAANLVKGWPIVIRA